MITHRGRYTSGRIAVANLSAQIAGLECDRVDCASFEGLLSLSKLLFLRGDILGRLADHDRAESVALQAVAMSPNDPRALYVRAQLASRFHRFDEANAFLDQALAAGHGQDDVDAERAALLQATGHYDEALTIRKRMARQKPGIDTLGAVATLFAEMDQWGSAGVCYAGAIEADDGISPFPCAQVLFEWGVNAMRRGDLDRAETAFAELDAILPAHVPGRGHRAEVALARGDLKAAEALIAPLLGIADDPEYRAVYAEILARRGHPDFIDEAALAAEAYERLLVRRPEAYADHAACFFIGVGNRPERALQLAELNLGLRDTPRSRKLLAKAKLAIQRSAMVGEVAA